MAHFTIIIASHASYYAATWLANVIVFTFGNTLGFENILPLALLFPAAATGPGLLVALAQRHNFEMQQTKSTDLRLVASTVYFVHTKMTPTACAFKLLEFTEAPRCVLQDFGVRWIIMIANPQEYNCIAWKNAWIRR